MNIPATSTNFDGIGNGIAGFTVNSAPPDPNIAVGPNHVLQIVNTDFAVYTKSGVLMEGPIAINTLWQSFGGLCQVDNDGDPVVRYDSIANRFLISQFAVMNPFLECIAVSQTGDPTGAYYRYAFAYSNFNDYPKIAIWPDAYYVTYNIFDAKNNFLTGKVCALDRANMLQGQAANQQCFDVGVNFGGLLASDFSGTMLPPAGAPNHVLALGAIDGQLAYWNFHVDWTNSANTNLTGPTILTTAPFTLPCGDTGGACIPESGGSLLDTLGDRLMYRLAYRNFGDHESLVTNHSVDVSGRVGARWYELRLDSSGNASIFQQSTYAPDSNSRWMGSIAMDQSGNMALGYSVSSSVLHPQIRYTGRLVTDPLNNMAQGEGTLFAGNGSQQNLTRWGDYSSMEVDPSDGCTFWYTNQYIPSDGRFNWRTRIASFKFPSCGASAGVITKTAGDGQSAVIGQPFATALQVLVRDSNGNPAQGAMVTFTAPGSGPSGTFAGGVLTATVTTDPSGIATAPAFTANGTPGSYNVSASAATLAPVNFSLTNIPGTASGQIAVFGTGVASASSLAADGSVDSHYTLISSADPSASGPNAYVANSNAFPIPPWANNGPNSKWITPLPNAAANLNGGPYTYRTTFDLTGLNPATAVLTGRWAADDSGVIKINGTVVPNSMSNSYTGLTPFTINSGFTAGVNTLDFVVTNASGPSGLRVDISGTASQSGTGGITVSVNPPSANLTASQTQQFTATVSGTSNTAVTWSLNPPSGPGTVSSSGLYTAPASIPSTQTVSVIATSVADSSKSGSATVTLQGGSGVVSVTVNPPSASLTASQTQQFTATVSGTSNTAVTWSLNPPSGPGTVSSSGLYTAPASIPSMQMVSVIATSVADSSKSGSATVTLFPASTGNGTIAVFGTGVASASSLAADGSVDGHYTLISSADPSASGPNAYVANSNAFPIPPWANNGPNSKWITPLPNAAANFNGGPYTYRTTFDLTGLNPATAVLTGRWAADDSGVIKINGTVVPNSMSNSYTGLTPFTINSGFIAGLNTLDFVVTNASGPSGLRVDISGTASQSGGGGVSVTVSPGSVSLTASQTQQFTATVSGTSNMAVTWTLNPPSGPGTVSSSGLYTAPSSISSTQTVSVIATSIADSSKSASATVTLQSGSLGVSVTVTPGNVSLTASQTQQFNATVSGTSNTAVTWSLNPPSGPGTLSSTGLYTAPSSIGSMQAVSVIATSVADSSKSGNATVTLIPASTGSGTIAVFGTGVASASSLAADGSVDSHYALISSADPSASGPNAYVANSNAFPIPPWANNGPNSKWITPLPNAAANLNGGPYTYRTTFDLTGLNPATAVLTGRWAADDSGVIKINGTVVPNSMSNSYTGLTPFTINSGFTAGVNTLDFVVTNASGPSGLRVDISGTASQSGTGGITVSVNPPSANLTASQTQQFTATVSGTSNTAVTWSLNPPSGPGTVSSSGLYTAPASIPSMQTVSVIATSVADSSKSGSATVTLFPASSGNGTIAVFGTGVASASSLAADGSVDSHYTLISSADPSASGPNAYVANSNAFPIPPWANNGPNSKWITPLPNAAANFNGGPYTYRTTFNLSGLNPATAVLTGRWAADDSGVIKINGTVVPNSMSNSYTGLTPFTITSGFIAGLNTLDFVVTNASGPTGLRVDISGTASQ